jgi:hypothetical protein
MTDIHARAARELMAYDPSSPLAWPDDLKSPGVAWLEDVASAMHSSVGVKNAAVRRAASDALGSARDVEALTDRLIAERGARCVGVWSSAAFILAAADADSIDVDEAKTRAAVRLLDRALPSLTGDARVAASVRLARLYEGLGEAEASERAWQTAIAARPLIAWLLPRSEWRASERAIAADPFVRAALEYERDPAKAMATVDSLVADGVSDAAIVRVAEHLRLAALGDPSTDGETIRRQIELGRALLAKIDDPVPRALLGAMFAIVGGVRSLARSELGALARIGGASSDAILDALSEMLMRPPRDPREILRTAWFEARIDPLVAFGEPRSAFAPLRRLLFGAILGVVIFGAASAAKAHTVPPETAPVAGAVSTNAGGTTTLTDTPQSADATANDAASEPTEGPEEVEPPPPPPPPELDDGPKVRPSFSGKSRWSPDGNGRR